MAAPLHPKETKPTRDTAAMLARAMSTPQDLATSLSSAPGSIARRYVLGRASARTSFKPATVNLPTDCVLVVVFIDQSRLVSYPKRSYAQGEQSSSVKRLCRLSAVIGEMKPARHTIVNSHLHADRDHKTLQSA